MAAADGKFPSPGYAHMILADVGGTQQLIVFGGRAFYGMDPATGKTLWESPWSTQYDVNAATPIYREGQVLISSEYSTAKGILYDVKPTGVTQVWESGDIKAKYQPPIVDDGYIYTNSRGTITCVQWSDGKTVWEAKDRKLKLGPGGSLLRAGDKLIALSERRDEPRAGDAGEGRVHRAEPTSPRRRRTSGRRPSSTTASSSPRPAKRSCASTSAPK